MRKSGETGLEIVSRRNLLTATAAGSLVAVATAAHAQDTSVPQPMRPGRGGTDHGPRGLMRDGQNPDLLNPPRTDSGTLPNLRFSFSDAHMRQEPGGWTRQVTVRELGISKTIAGVNMRLNVGGTRELHWHKQAEWAYMLYGTARITAVNATGNNFVDGEFDEDGTFLLSDWVKHVPPAVLGKNFGVDAKYFGHTPDPRERYIFNLPVPGPLAGDKIAGAAPVPTSFSHKMMAQTPIKTKGGTVRITDSSNFPASKTIAAALVEIEPGGMRELHWHPNADEWQYYIEGQGRMGVFGAVGAARTFDYTAGDVGYVPFAMGHYIENTGDKTLRFLEMFRTSNYADVSLDQWLALSPPELVQGHLNLEKPVMDALRKQKVPVVGG